VHGIHDVCNDLYLIVTTAAGLMAIDFLQADNVGGEPANRLSQWTIVAELTVHDLFAQRRLIGTA